MMLGEVLRQIVLLFSSRKSQEVEDIIFGVELRAVSFHVVCVGVHEHAEEKKG